MLNLSKENHGRLDEADAEPHDIDLPGAFQLKFKELHDDHVNYVYIKMIGQKRAYKDTQLSDRSSKGTC